MRTWLGSHCGLKRVPCKQRQGQRIVTGCRQARRIPQADLRLHRLRAGCSPGPEAQSSDGRRRESRHRVAVGGDTLAQKILVDKGVWDEGDDPKAIAERVTADSRGAFEAELAVRVSHAR